MESIGVGPWIAIAVAVGAIGVLVGYWLGTRMGGHNTEPMRELHREQNAYKEEVREHFEQVSATMTRMVDDYREMYNHVAKGAEKLADMHHETVIEPPPKPEAITQDHRTDGAESESPAAPKAETSKSDTRTTAPHETEARKTEASAAAITPVGSSASRAAPSATAPTASGAAAKSSASPSASAAGKPSTATATERPQDAAIRAAAKDAATAQKR